MTTKVTRVFILALAFAVVFVNTAGAISIYRDDFTSAANAPERIYSGIRPYTYPAGSIAYGTFANDPHPIYGYSASVTYNLQGACEIRLGLYSSVGTFVQNDPEFGWTLGVGSMANSAGTVSLSPAAPMYGIDADGTAGVFAQIEGAWRQLYWDRAGASYYCFAAPGDTPLPQPQSLKNYAVNVYANGKPLPLTRARISYHPNPVEKCYEEFSAQIPAGATSITIEINDFYRIPTLLGGNVFNEPRRAVGLAFVELDLDEVKAPEPNKERSPRLLGFDVGFIPL